MRTWATQDRTKKGLKVVVRNERTTPADEVAASVAVFVSGYGGLRVVPLVSADSFDEITGVVRKKEAAVEENKPKKLTWKTSRHAWYIEKDKLEGRMMSAAYDPTRGTWPRQAWIAVMAVGVGTSIERHFLFDFETDKVTAVSWRRPVLWLKERREYRRADQVVRSGDYD